MSKIDTSIPSNSMQVTETQQRHALMQDSNLLMAAYFMLLESVDLNTNTVATKSKILEKNIDNERRIQRRITETDLLHAPDPERVKKKVEGEEITDFKNEAEVRNFEAGNELRTMMRQMYEQLLANSQQKDNTLANNISNSVQSAQEASTQGSGILSTEKDLIYKALLRRAPKYT